MKGIIVEKDGTIRLADDIPMPEPGPYEALVKIESCMICYGNYSGRTAGSSGIPDSSRT